MSLVHVVVQVEATKIIPLIGENASLLREFFRHEFRQPSFGTPLGEATGDKRRLGQQKTGTCYKLYPPSKLRYPTTGKETSSLKLPFDGIC